MLRGRMFSQIMIACTGVVAIWLANDPDENKRKYAPIFGLLGQPFWMWSAYEAAQWGIFMLSFVYLASWWRGFKEFWL
jgi:hypothetical protein